jgi:hypothetical protein
MCLEKHIFSRGSTHEVNRLVRLLNVGSLPDGQKKLSYILQNSAGEEK